MRRLQVTLGQSALRKSGRRWVSQIGFDHITKASNVFVEHDDHNTVPSWLGTTPENIEEYDMMYQRGEFKANLQLILLLPIRYQEQRV